MVEMLLGAGKIKSESRKNHVRNGGQIWAYGQYIYFEYRDYVSTYDHNSITMVTVIPGYTFKEPQLQQQVHKDKKMIRHWFPI